MRLAAAIFIVSSLASGVAVHGQTVVFPGDGYRYELPAQNQMIRAAIETRLGSGYNRPLDKLFTDNSFDYAPTDPLGDNGAIWLSHFGELYENSGSDLPHFKTIAGWHSVDSAILKSFKYGAHLLFFNYPSVQDMSGKPCPGDIVRIRLGGKSGSLLCMIWTGNSYFPHLKNVAGHYVSLFCYPLFSHYPLQSDVRKLQRNTWPPRINQSLQRPVTRILGHKLPPDFFENGWLTRNMLSESGEGVYGGFYLPISQWKKSPTQFEYQVLRRTGAYDGFNANQQRTVEEDLKRAMKIADLCYRQLAGKELPPGLPQSANLETDVVELLDKCFDIDPSDKESRAVVARRYRSFREEIALALIAYSPSYNDTEDGRFAFVKSKVTRFLMLLDEGYFSTGRTGIQRSSTLIHEYCHAAGMGGHPGTGRYGRESDAVGSFLNKPPGFKVSYEHKMVQLDADGNPLGYLNWKNARRNAYSYGFFALWLARRAGL